MKKYLIILLAACAALVSCNKEKQSGGGSTTTSTPSFGFTYTMNQTVKDALTLVLTVDGKTYNLNQLSDTQVYPLAAKTGTIKLECKNDATKKYTEKTDLSLSLVVSVGSKEAGKEGLSSFSTVFTGSMSNKGMAAENVMTYLNKRASELSGTATYVVDDSGKVSIK